MLLKLRTFPSLSNIAGAYKGDQYNEYLKMPIQAEGFLSRLKFNLKSFLGPKIPSLSFISHPYQAIRADCCAVIVLCLKIFLALMESLEKGLLFLKPCVYILEVEGAPQ